MSWLMILEVSQKQAYIFGSTKLKENIARSEEICRVTDAEYFYQAAQAEGVFFDKDANVVYSGGGHTVLEFADEETAKNFAFLISRTVKKEYPEIELFIKTIPYEEAETPGENLKRLSEALEAKKSVRAAVFHQGTFGVEKADSALRKPVYEVKTERRTAWNQPEEYVPQGYVIPKQFENIGNSKNDSSFIAVVHIDGNAMGKRVEAIRRKNQYKTWSEYKKILKQFSESIDRDFKAAYREMMERVAENLKKEKLSALDVKDKYFPVRQIILAGDDVCFVTEGRIGLEAARIFVEKLAEKTNSQDGRGYAACAGVAIVHQKYPFYKAYELAEMLCSNAKKYIASLADGQSDTGSGACAIDWHVEFGEIADTLGRMREKYITADNKTLELRPYLLSAEKDIWEKERLRRYENFRSLITALQSEKIAYARSKIKELREALKEGEAASGYYLRSKLISELELIGYEGIFRDLDYSGVFKGEGLERRTFVETTDGKERSLYFDAVELLDTFVELD